jgi:hypothetical protein
VRVHFVVSIQPKSAEDLGETMGKGRASRPSEQSQVRREKSLEVTAPMAYDPSRQNRPPEINVTWILCHSLSDELSKGYCLRD